MTPCDWPIQQLVPHSEPMILLDRVLGYTEISVTAGLTITVESSFLRDGKVPAYIALEYMAQAITAYDGVQARLSGGAIGIGFLLGSRKLKLMVNEFEPGDELVVVATMQYNDGEMSAFDCQTYRQQQLVAEATISVFKPPDPQQLLVDQNST